MFHSPPDLNGLFCERRNAPISIELLNAVWLRRHWDKNLGKARNLFEAYHLVPWRRWMKVSARQVYAAFHSQDSQVGAKS